MWNHVYQAFILKSESWRILHLIWTDFSSIFRWFRKFEEAIFLLALRFFNSIFCLPWQTVIETSFNCHANASKYQSKVRRYFEENKARNSLKFALITFAQYCIGYAAKLSLNLQLSVHCLLSDINLNLKLQRENVPNVGGVVNQVSYRRGAQFYAFNVQIFPRSFGCAHFTQIDQILSM